ncbi:MAG TPA: hypothetical protein VIW47_01575 [Nitrospiraceae bacterium]
MLEEWVPVVAGESVTVGLDGREAEAPGRVEEVQERASAQAKELVVAAIDREQVKSLPQIIGE